jgi:hypothetical protein
MEGAELVDPAEARLEGFLLEFLPETAALMRDARAKLRGLFPDAVELVYDNYNALVIGFGPSERPSEAPLSLALVPRWVNLCFLHAADLPDPAGLLLGSGKVARHMKIYHAGEIDAPAVQALIRQAADRAGMFTRRAGEERKVVIRSVSPKRRPRRPC